MLLHVRAARTRSRIPQQGGGEASDGLGDINDRNDGEAIGALDAGWSRTRAAAIRAMSVIRARMAVQRRARTSRGGPRRAMTTQGTAASADQSHTGCSKRISTEDDSGAGRRRFDHPNTLGRPALGEAC